MDYENLSQGELDDLAKNTIGGVLGGACAALGNSSGKDADPIQIMKDLEYTTDSAYKTEAIKLAKVLELWALGGEQYHR